jgi:hypothetical protein
MAILRVLLDAFGTVFSPSRPVVVQYVRFRSSLLRPPMLTVLHRSRLKWHALMG